MGEMASLWGYAEHGEIDQLGQKLLYTSLELEKLKSEAMEEMQKNNEYAKQLIQLLKCAIEERDEARNQLDKLIISSSHFHGGKAAANSSITESNSLSETPPHNYHSPTVDSLEMIQDSCLIPAVDRGSLIVDRICKGRALPRKGMLLQAVLEAGPLLQTLMVAGPLPTWRNPPQMLPFQIPAVPIKGGELEALKPPGYSFSNINVGNIGDVNCGLSNSNNSCLSINAFSGNDDSFRLGKRQRFC